MKILPLFFILISFLIASSLRATVTDTSDYWDINKDHSEIFFQVPYLNVSEVTGRFTQFSGGLIFNEQGALKFVDLKIDATSIDTGNRLRDGHLRSNEFLKSKDHPFITFSSYDISKKKQNEFQASGEISIGGVRKLTTMNFGLTDKIKDTWNYESRFVKFRTSISRKDFKILWNKTLTENQYLIGDNITVWGTFQVQPMQKGTPGSKHMIPDTAYIRNREKLNRGEIPPLAPTKVAPSIAPNTPVRERIIIPEVATDAPKLKPDIRKTTRWLISFWIISLMGFFAVIIFGLYAKNRMIKRYPEKYREGGSLGAMTDAVTIVVVLLYCVALWEVGWGQS